MTDKKAIMIAAGLKFIESSDMREYLQSPGAPMSLRRWCHAITAARATLAEKAAMLRMISEHYPFDEQELNLCDPGKMADAALLALHEANNAPPGSVFLLTRYNRSLPWAIAEHWRFDDHYNARQSSEVFAAFPQALERITEERSEEGVLLTRDKAERIDYGMCWNEINRYDQNPDGRMEVSYTWYVGESGAVWGFDFDGKRRSLCDDHHMFSPWNEMTLPLPFQPGDIITHDCRPYYGVFHCLILNNAAPWDCCSPQCAFMCDYGRVNVGAFHHIPNNQPRRFSPSLRAARFTGKLPKREEPLNVLSDKIRDNPELTDAFWQFIAYGHGHRGRNINRDAAPKDGVAWKDIRAEFGW